MKDAIISFLKGLWIGGTMTVPGVSGGAMAMIMGIYDRLIYSVSHLFKEFKKSVLFLAVFACGGGIGAVLFSKIITFLLNNFGVPFRFFFVGAIAGGIPLMLKSARVKKFSPACIICPLIGGAIVVGIWLLTKKQFGGGMPSLHDSAVKYIIFSLIAGVLAAIALVVPGISLTHIFAMLGIFAPIMAAVGDLDIKALLQYIPMGLVCVVGTFLIAKILEPAMNNYPTPTYLTIFGFLLGSIPALLFDPADKGADAAASVSYSDLSAVMWIVSILCAALGFFALYMLSRFEIKRINETAKEEAAE